MKNFCVRLLTGIVYVAVIIVGLFLKNEAVFFTLFGLLMFSILGEFYKNLKVKNIRVNIPLTMLLSLLIFIEPILKSCGVGINLLPVILLVSLAIFAIELFVSNDDPFHRIAFTFLGIVYIVFPFTLLASYGISGEYNAFIIFTLFLFTWANDSFAYLTGMAFGKHPLSPTISPKKTVEGFLGGLVLTVAIAALVDIYIVPQIFDVNSVPMFFFAGLSVIVVIFSTLGDLVESKFKRYLGVKDSGKALPGHGGFLDRFDSIIFSIPAFFAYLQTI